MLAPCLVALQVSHKCRAATEQEDLYHLRWLSQDQVQGSLLQSQLMGTAAGH